MSHIYSDTFFNYIDQGARRSAREVLALLAPQLQPTSVIDFGAGRGVWLDEWRKTGAQDILAVDGDYVDRHQLAVPQESFRAADLTAPGGRLVYVTCSVLRAENEARIEAFLAGHPGWRLEETRRWPVGPGGDGFCRAVLRAPQGS